MPDCRVQIAPTRWHPLGLGWYWRLQVRSVGHGSWATVKEGFQLFRWAARVTGEGAERDWRNGGLARSCRKLAEYEARAWQ